MPSSPTGDSADKPEQRGYLTDHSGKPSSTRFFSLLSTIIAAALTGLIGLIVYEGRQVPEIEFVFYLVLVWIGAATAPQAIAKYIEGMFFNPEAKSGFEPRREKN